MRNALLVRDGRVTAHDWLRLCRRRPHLIRSYLAAHSGRFERHNHIPRRSWFIKPGGKASYFLAVLDLLGIQPLRDLRWWCEKLGGVVLPAGTELTDRMHMTDLCLNPIEGFKSHSVRYCDNPSISLRLEAHRDTGRITVRLMNQRVRLASFLPGFLPSFLPLMLPSFVALSYLCLLPPLLQLLHRLYTNLHERLDDNPGLNFPRRIVASISLASLLQILCYGPPPALEDLPTGKPDVSARASMCTHPVCENPM